MAVRRQFLTGGAVAAASVWVAPSVVRLDRAAAASGSGQCETPNVFGGAQYTTAPTITRPGGPLEDFISFVWNEHGPCELTQDLVVNRVTAGSFTGSSNENQVIPQGTCVCSFFVHGDRLDDDGLLTGTMTFGSTTILGLIYRTAELLASDELETPGTSYTYGAMEPGDTMDLDLTPGANSFSWEMLFGTGLDQVRVITSCP